MANHYSNKGGPGRNIAVALCKKFADAPSNQLGRMLREEHPEIFATLNAANCMVRDIRGNRGKARRKSAAVPKPNGKAGEWVQKFPTTIAEPWLPVELETPCRVLVMGDWHIPFHDERAITTAIKHAKEHYRPTVLLINGDYGDWTSISRFQKYRKAAQLHEELRIMCEGLSWLRGQFPKQRRIFKMGNHDDWWDSHIMNNSPQFADCEFAQIENVLHFDKFGFEKVGDNFIKAGHLAILHGHEAGKGSSAVNPSRGMFLKTNATTLSGHNHRPSSHTDPDMYHSETTAWSHGCLCTLTPRYARINKWRLGHAVVDVDKRGEFNVHNLAISSNSYKVRTA